MLPLVSILIPCYNAAGTLAAAIESCLGQTWSNCEIIVVNDGSTDESLAVAREFSVRGVAVISQPRRGASAARNGALRSASGAFIQYLDADDVLAFDKIANQLTPLALAEPHILHSCRWARFRRNIAYRVPAPDSLLHTDLTPEVFLRTKFSTGAMMPVSAWLMSRDLARAAGAWDERLTRDDDGEYFTRVVLASHRIVFCGSVGTYCRVSRSDSLSRLISESAWTSELMSVHAAVDHFLACYDTLENRRSSADALQRCALEAYPACKSLRAQTMVRVLALGGSKETYRRSPRFAMVARFLGWKMAKRLLSIWTKSRFLASGCAEGLRLGKPRPYNSSKNDPSRGIAIDVIIGFAEPAPKHAHVPGFGRTADDSFDGLSQTARILRFHPQATALFLDVDFVGQGRRLRHNHRVAHSHRLEQVGKSTGRLFLLVSLNNDQRRGAP